MYSAKKKSVLVEVLLALIPYSRQNLALSYKPSKFFNDLDRISAYKKSSLRYAHSQAEQKGLIIRSGSSWELSAKAVRKVQPFIAKKLKKGSFLMVIFDIPEEYSTSRTRFRRLLKYWDFKLLQKSVWSSDMDYTKALIEAIDDYGLSDFVQVYESAALFQSKK